MSAGRNALITETASLILTGGNRTTALNVRTLLTDVFNSFANINDDSPLLNTSVSNPLNGDILQFNGTAWVNTPAGSDVLNTVLTGFAANNAVITATDTVLIGFNKAQGQINAIKTTLTTVPTGSGTTGYVPKWTSSTALGNSLIYDDGNSVIIGATSAPSFEGTPLVITTTHAQFPSFFISSDVVQYIIYSDLTQAYSGTLNNHKFGLLQNGNIFFNINTSGLTAIGNDFSASASLHIQGKTSDNTAYAFKIDDSSSDGLLYVRNDGAVIFGDEAASIIYDSNILASFDVNNRYMYGITADSSTNALTVYNSTPTALLTVRGDGIVSMPFQLFVGNNLSIATYDILQINYSNGVNFIAGTTTFNLIKGSANAIRKQGSGTLTINGLILTPTYQQTTGGTGIINATGINLLITDSSPQTGSSTSITAISSVIILNGLANYGTGQIKNIYIQNTSISGQTGALTDAYGIYIDVPNWQGAAALKSYGIRIFNQSDNLQEFSYAIYIDPQSSYSGSYGIVSMAAYNGFGIASPTEQVHVQGNVWAGGYKSQDGSVGINTTVTTGSLVGKTITIKNGLITSFQ